MLARAIEANGLPTTTLALIKEHAMRTKPPRAVFVPFSFGYALGKPNDPEFQHKVLRSALDLFSAESVPVLVEFPEDGDAPAAIVQASAANKDTPNTNETDPADELTAMRGYYERWIDGHDGRTMVGMTGVPQRRWRGLVKFLQAYADGEDLDYEERPADVPLPRFIRLAADDLKAFYMEGRMCQRPDQQNNDLQRWFWSETAVGGMLQRIADRMNASEDEAVKRQAFGIAR